MRCIDQTRLFRWLMKLCSIILKREEQYVNKHDTRFDNDEICLSLPCCHLSHSPVLLPFPLVRVPLSGVTDSQGVTLIPVDTNDN